MIHTTIYKQQHEVKQTRTSPNSASTAAGAASWGSDDTTTSRAPLLFLFDFIGGVRGGDEAAAFISWKFDDEPNPPHTYLQTLRTS
jgi:hypothetical protein